MIADIWNRLRNYLGTNSDSASSTGSAHAKLAQALANLSTLLGKSIISQGSAIKSIQSGVHAGNTSTYDIPITISAVNPAKCMVILNPAAIYLNGNSHCVPMLKSLTSTQLTVSASGNSSSSAQFSWQVIEFI